MNCKPGDLAFVVRPGTSTRNHMVRVDLDVPTRVTNASSKEPLKLKPISVRPGSEDFLRCKSLGSGC